MVARQFAPGRAAAVAIVATLLLTVLPTPGAQAQAVHDVAVVQGSASFFQSNFLGKPTSFIDSGTNTAVLSVPISHTGPSALENATVFWNLAGGPTDAQVTRNGCVKVTLPANNGATPGAAWANITLETKDLPMGPYNVTVNAFTPRPTSVTNDCTGSRTRAVGGTNTCTPGPDCQADVNTGNNALNAYFIKDQTMNLDIQEIRWCRGGDTEGLCETNMLDGNEQWNTTSQARTHRTFFEVVVKNVGSWQNLSNYGGPCACANDGFAYELNVSIRGAYIPGALNVTTTAHTTSSGSEGDGSGTVHFARSEIFDLVNMSGTYNVTVKLDPRRELRFLPGEAADVRYRNVDVLYRDFTGNITASDLRTNPASPYPYDGPFPIRGNVTFRNDGPAGLRGGSSVEYQIFIDNTSGFLQTGTYTVPEAGSSKVVEYVFQVTSTGGQANYIPPGRHTLWAKIDTSGDPDLVTSELNESNNNMSVDFFIADTTKPTFRSVPKVTLAGPRSFTEGVTQDAFFPLEEFTVHAEPVDDDNGLTVVANFTLDSNASVFRSYNMTRGTDRASVTPTNFTFHNFSAVPVNGFENWTLRVTATDSSGNNATTAGQKLRLRPWPIHAQNASEIVLLPAYPHDQILWDGQDNPTWLIRVLPNMTGFYGTGRGASPQNAAQEHNQQNYTANLGLRILTPKNQTATLNGSFWDGQTDSACLTNSTGAGGNLGNTNLPGASTCTPAGQESNNTFRTAITKTDYGPGNWSYTVIIKDLAGFAREINGTIMVLDKSPEFHTVNLSTDHVDPGANFTINANLSDDDDTITSAHVNFTRVTPGDGAWVNLTLTEYESIPGTGVTYYNYTQTFKTGRHEVFGLGGTFNATIAARDLTGNWNTTSMGQLRVKDEDAPVISQYGVVPAAVEVGENVTFWAKASDATNTTVKLEIFRSASSSELLRDAIYLNESLDGNYTATLNFTAEGVYGFRLTPTDSVNLAGAVSVGTIAVRDNLGPKFEIRSPGVLIDGTRYGSGMPRIEVVAFDIEGVNPSSVDVKVAGLPVDHSIVPAPGNLNGFLITYDVKANKKFSHRDVVEVNITAQDNSTERLTSYLNFSFLVDDVAPVARLSSIAPSYRDQPAHALNVSLNTRFTLTAEDADGLPTSVDSIRYRILGGGPSAAETVYTTPFKINDAPGVYQGPRLYQIQYWAEDAVGNVNKNFNVTTVFVDDTPPALYQFFPQNRFINVTFVDDRVGVNRSVVWYRENTQPYVPLPLVEKDGAWSLTLPEGVKGDVVAYYIQVWDRLDNTETFGSPGAPYASFNVSNREPVIRITAPVEGSRVFRQVDLTWEASDIDGDALVFTLFIKEPGQQNFRELTKIENTATRRYTVDTTRYPDGQYTLRVAAGDGGFVKLAETTITIINSARAVGQVVVPQDALPGSTMLVTAEVTKAEAVVEARLYLDGELVPPAYPMNDAGREGDVAAKDGIYSVRVPVSGAGDYSVEIFTQYREDGVLKEFTSEPVTFSAKLTPSYLLSEYGAIIAIIGLLAAVGIGVAVFVVVRRR